MEKLLEKMLPRLICVQCGGEETLSNNSSFSELKCNQCEASFSYRENYIDFIPDYKGGSGIQKTMENQFIVDVYEDHIRPNFTALGSVLKYSDEEDWLKNVEYNGAPEFVLDLASGSGRYARWFVDAYKPNCVVCLDVSKPMLKKAALQHKCSPYESILHIRADASKLPIKTASINWVNCFGALHLFNNPNVAIEEISRVCKTDSVFTFLTAARVKNALSKKTFQKVFSMAARFNFFDVEELEKTLSERNLVNFNKSVDDMVLLGKCTKG